MPGSLPVAWMRPLEAIRSLLEEATPTQMEAVSSSEMGNAAATEGMLRRLHDGQASIVQMQARMQEVQIRLVSFVEERLQEHLHDWREHLAVEVSAQLARVLPEHLAIRRLQLPASFVDRQGSCPQQADADFENKSCAEASGWPPPPLDLSITPLATSVFGEGRNASSINLGLATTPVGTSAIVEAAEEQCESKDKEQTVDPNMLEELSRLEEIVRNHSHEARRRAAGCRPSSPSQPFGDSAGTLSTATASNPSLASASTRSVTPPRPPMCKPRRPTAMLQADVRDYRKQFKQEDEELPVSRFGSKEREFITERVASLTPTAVRSSGQAGTPLAEILAVRRSISEGIPLEPSVIADQRRNSDKYGRKVPGFGTGNSVSHNSLFGQRAPLQTPGNTSSAGLAATASTSLAVGRFRRGFRRTPRPAGQMLMGKQPATTAATIGNTASCKATSHTAAAAIQSAAVAVFACNGRGQHSQ